MVDEYCNILYIDMSILKILSSQPERICSKCKTQTVMYGNIYLYTGIYIGESVIVRLLKYIANLLRTHKLEQNAYMREVAVMSSSSSKTITVSVHGRMCFWRGGVCWVVNLGPRRILIAKVHRHANTCVSNTHVYIDYMVRVHYSHMFARN